MKYTKKAMRLDRTRRVELASNLRKMKVLIKAQFLEAWSYGKLFMIRTAFNWAFLQVVMLYFVGLTFGGELGGWVAEYGGSYFMFVLVGIILDDLGNLAFSSTSQFLLTAQRRGSLESLLMTPTGLWVYAVSYMSSGTLEAAIRGVGAFTAAMVILGGRMVLSSESILLSFLFFLLFILSTFFLGLMSAGFVVMIKQRTEPVSWAIGWTSRLLSGVYYPVSILPSWIHALAWVLPQTHALNGMRLVLLGGLTWQPIVMNSLTFLAALNVLFFVLGILFLRFGFKFARRQGSLGHY